MAANPETRRQLRELMKAGRDPSTKDGAAARLLFHRLCVKHRKQAGVPPWVLENAREKGVKV